jgi:CheY-like chemotaxis protein
VAEDNTVNQLVLLRLPERYGLTVDLVSNGLEAVRRCESAEDAVILMDCRMPLLDGYEATRRIRRHENATGRHTPIIAITANAMARERELCEEAGMDDYLPNPIQPTELAGYARTPDTEPRAGYACQGSEGAAPMQSVTGCRRKAPFFRAGI